MNTMIYTKGHFISLCVHVVPIAMSPIQEDKAGMERVTGCIRLIMSGMPTGSCI